MIGKMSLVVTQVKYIGVKEYFCSKTEETIISTEKGT